MKLFSWLVLGLLVTAGATLAAMQSAPVFFASDSLHWVAATGPAKGSWNAVMVGNPNSSGTAIIRVKMPDGYTNKPHYHSHAEYITVIQGTLLFGTGDTIDKSDRAGVNGRVVHCLFQQASIIGRSPRALPSSRSTEKGH